MSTPIANTVPRTQAIATAGQTVFNANNWTADVDTDVRVYARATGAIPNDVTQLVPDTEYSVAFLGAARIVEVTFFVGRTLDDIITLSRETPTDRENLYTNTNFTPSMLNQDFEVTTLTQQQNKLYREQIGPRYNVSASLGLEAQSTYPNATENTDLILPKLGADQVWAMNGDASAIIAADVPSGGVAPSLATYITQTPTIELPNEQALSLNATGIMQSTTATGVVKSVTIEGVADHITITDGDGALGNPKVDIADNPIIPGNARINVPSGDTASRPSPTGTLGDFRYNTDTNVLEYSDGTQWLDVGSGSGSGEVICKDINQVAHGFAVNEVIRLDGTNVYAKAQADNEVNAESVGIVTAVADVDNFTLCMSGFAETFTGLVANTVYFLSQTAAGALTATPPALDGEVSKPVLISSSATQGYIVNYRGEIIGGSLIGAAPDTATYWTTTNETTALPNSQRMNDRLEVLGAGNLAQHLGIENATLSSVGSDTDIDLKFLAKGAGNYNCNGTTSLLIPTGTTAQEPTPIAGRIRYDTDQNALTVADGAAFNPVGGGGGGGFTSINIQTFAASGTYTPTAGMIYCIIETVGGGGGGSGAVAAPATVSRSGSSGGGGGYARASASAATIGASQTVTIGAGGAGGLAGATSGSTGGTTSLGAICAAAGGLGALYQGDGGLGGAGVNGNFISSGGAGGAYESTVSNSSTGRTISGGESYFGAGGKGSRISGGGQAGIKGGGGGGGLSINPAGAAAGGAGGDGFMVITEYIA